MPAQRENAKSPLPIRPFGDPVLRVSAERVNVEHIESPEIQNIVEDMIASLKAAGGIGLAAPQIGISKRIIIIEISSMFRVGYGEVPETPLTILINPEFVYTSSETRRAPEACLSVRTADGGFYEGLIERPDRVSVKAYDRFGHEIVVDGDKLFGRALQHEIDHLNGILLTDLVQDIKDLRIVYYSVRRDDPVLEWNRYISREV